MLQRLPSRREAGTPRRPRPVPPRLQASPHCPSCFDPGAAFRHAATAIVITDAAMHIVAANPAYAELTGLPEHRCVGTLLPGAQAGASNVAPCKVVFDRRGGGTRTAWMSLSAVTDELGRVQSHIATFTDISELERERELLRHLAQHDLLTQLPNRRLLGAELERCVARARRHGQQLALLFVDLDRFKCVNDTLGHEVGDALLVEIARRLRATVRAEDLVARWGGDEFVVVLDDPADAAAATRSAGLLLAAIERTVETAGHRMNVSASIGVAMFPGDGTAPAALLRAGDAAMYRAKQLGRGRVGAVGRDSTG